MLKIALVAKNERERKVGLFQGGRIQFGSATINTMH